MTVSPELPDSLRASQIAHVDTSSPGYFDWFFSSFWYTHKKDCAGKEHCLRGRTMAQRQKIILRFLDGKLLKGYIQEVTIMAKTIAYQYRFKVSAYYDSMSSVFLKKCKKLCKNNNTIFKLIYDINSLTCDPTSLLQRKEVKKPPSGGFFITN